MDKNLISGSTTMLILKLLDGKDMYGYQMIEELLKQSNETFKLKAGTLYPILHNLENEGMLESYDDNADNLRIRKYYHLTKQGKKLLDDKQKEWKNYMDAVNNVLNGGVCLGTN